jgi:hypothetical protein
MILEPFVQIAGSSGNCSLAFKPREPLLVAVLFADSLAFCDGNDLGDWGVAVVHNDRAPSADVIEIARKAVSELRDFGFFHDSWIIAKLALSGYEVDAASASA